MLDLLKDASQVCMFDFEDPSDPKRERDLQRDAEKYLRMCINISDLVKRAAKESKDVTRSVVLPLSDRRTPDAISSAPKVSSGDFSVSHVAQTPVAPVRDLTMATLERTGSVLTSEDADLENDIQRLLPFFYQVTGCRMRVAKLALDAIAQPPYRSFRQVFESGVRLDKHFFERLKLLFPENCDLRKSSMPVVLLQLIAAARVPLNRLALRCNAKFVLPDCSDSIFDDTLDRLGSFLSRDEKGLIFFQQHAVEDWIRHPDPSVARHPDRFDVSLNTAHTALAAFDLMLLHFQCPEAKTDTASTEEFLVELLQSLLKLTPPERYLDVFKRMELPNLKELGIEAYRVVQYLVLHLEHVKGADQQLRQRLLQKAGIEGVLRESRSAFLQKAIESDSYLFVRSLILDLKADMRAKLQVSDAKAELPLTLASRLNKTHTVSELLRLRADVSADNFGAVNAAIAGKHEDVLDILLANANCKCVACGGTPVSTV